MYRGLDELTEKVTSLKKRVDDLEDEVWKYKSIAVDLAVCMELNSQEIIRITGASAEDIELSKIFKR